MICFSPWGMSLSGLSDRRRFLQQSGALMAGVAARSAGVKPGQRRRNVLFLAVDDLRPALGCYGDRYAVTPNIDGLAARGVRFAHAYCQQAVCNPSRQSLMTGRRPDTIRVWDLKTHFRKTSPGVESLPEVFRRQGYFAQSFGKIYHGEAPMADPESWSVPEQFQYTPKSDQYRLARNHVHRTAGKADADEWVDASDDDYPDGEVAKAAVTALERLAAEQERQPFFLAVGMRKPHLPFTAPLRYWEMFASRVVPPIDREAPPDGAPELALHDSKELRGYLGIPQSGPIPTAQAERLRRGYYAAMAYTDAQVGRVLRALRQTGLDRETVIVFWADHGYHLGEHGLWCKTTNYERDTHVPLIVADPMLPGGAVCEALVELVDVFPTLCEMCGVAPPTGLEGKSLTPWLRDPKHASPAAARSQFPRPWFYRGQPETMGYTVRTKTHRYVEWRRFGTEKIVARELYEVRAGMPDETVNLAGRAEFEALMREMRGYIV